MSAPKQSPDQIKLFLAQSPPDPRKAMVVSAEWHPLAGILEPDPELIERRQKVLEDNIGFTVDEAEAETGPGIYRKDPTNPNDVHHRRIDFPPHPHLNHNELRIADDGNPDQRVFLGKAITPGQVKLSPAEQEQFEQTQALLDERVAGDKSYHDDPDFDPYWIL